MPSPYENLQVQTAEGIARVTIHRPQALNALNTRTLQELAHCLEAVAADPALRCLILTGSGEKAFVAGADIAELRGLDGPAGLALNAYGQQVFRRMETLGKVSIAAVNGYALGGGCELALACSLRLAAENASFGLPELGLGLIPGFGGTQRLSRLVGPARALEIILTGRRLDARAALAVGLVSQVTAPADLLSTAEALARRIMTKAPVAVCLALDAVLRGAEMPLDAGLAYELSLSGLAFATADKEEGLTAFLEKRQPLWQGR